MSEKEKKKSCADWEAFAERCAVKPEPEKPKAKAKGKSNASK